MGSAENMVLEISQFLTGFSVTNMVSKRFPCGSYGVSQVFRCNTWFLSGFQSMFSYRFITYLCRIKFLTGFPHRGKMNDIKRSKGKSINQKACGQLAIFAYYT